MVIKWHNAPHNVPKHDALGIAIENKKDVEENAEEHSLQLALIIDSQGMKY